MFERAVILSASVGAGHMRAAQAIERAMRAASPESHADQVRLVDVLEHANPLFRAVYKQGYVWALRRAPNVVGWAYDRIDRPFSRAALRSLVQRLMMRRLRQLLERERPDLVVCTHFLPAEIVAGMRRNGFATRLAVVVTDMDAHALWLHEGIDHYFVALDETAAYLRALGVDPTRITTSGIPIDPVFGERRDPIAMRHRHGLALDRPIVLLAAGGLGIGPMANAVESLLAMRSTAQLVVICGRNEPLRRRLADLADSVNEGTERLRVIGFTHDMHELMAAADLLVGKPGGLSTSEAMACGLPILVLDPVPGQEERNSDHLLEDGVALRCNMLETLAWKVDRFLADPRRRASMRDAALEFARPGAAQTIVEALRSRARGQIESGSIARPATTAAGAAAAGLPFL